MSCCGPTPGESAGAPIVLGAWDGLLTLVEPRVQFAGLRRGRRAWVTGADVPRYLASGHIREV